MLDSPGSRRESEFPRPLAKLTDSDRTRSTPRVCELTIGFTSPKLEPTAVVGVASVNSRLRCAT
jgi:hypothetical protein